MADAVDKADDLDLPLGEEAVNRLIKENSQLFSDSHCKVCSAVLISESQKLAHYQSKKHASKYRRYLTIHQVDAVTPAKRRAEGALDASEEADRNKCCPVCNMTFTSPVVASSHYEGRTHAKNLRMKVQGGVTEAIPVTKKPRLSPPAPVKNTATTDRSDPEKFCQLCNATFNNPHMAQQHYAGKKHKKQETKSKLMTIYSTCGNSMPQSTPLAPLTAGSPSTGNGFSCDICNVVTNSIAQYEAHISGAKHKNNLMSMVPTSVDSVPTSDSTDPNTATNPSSGGFYSAPPYNVMPPPPPPRPDAMLQGSSGFGSGFFSMPPFSSQNFAHKELTGPGSDGYQYFTQDY